jgi:protein-L-isoaspartate(D-aspartate) O-methyltransferase
MRGLDGIGMSDFALARTNMVESQVRPNGVTDARILSLMARLPRENFLPAHLRAIAYMDEDIKFKPAAAGAPARYMMQPMLLARLLQLAAIEATDVVLHVGCATGYGTALLTGLGHSVLAVDEDDEMAGMAVANLAELGMSNAKVVNAPHAEGFAMAAPYDVILIEGHIPEVPQALLKQLEDNGRLVAITGKSMMAKARVYTRHRDTVSARAAFDAAVPVLPGFAVKGREFVF